MDTTFLRSQLSFLIGDVNWEDYHPLGFYHFLTDHEVIWWGRSDGAEHYIVTATDWQRHVILERFETDSVITAQNQWIEFCMPSIQLRIDRQIGA